MTRGGKWKERDREKRLKGNRNKNWGSCWCADWYLLQLLLQFTFLRLLKGGMKRRWYNREGQRDRWMLRNEEKQGASKQDAVLLSFTVTTHQPHIIRHKTRQYFLLFLFSSQFSLITPHVTIPIAASSSWFFWILVNRICKPIESWRTNLTSFAIFYSDRFRYSLCFLG